jgi:serine/threonine-protein kinase
MSTEELNDQLVREELVRVLSSSAFVRNERLSRFLRFLVERHLEGKDQEIKESLIGFEVFGRRPDYDPKLDSIVRTEAVRLRARLAEYYAGEGAHDPSAIEIPKGGYVPRCLSRNLSGRQVGRPKHFWLLMTLSGVLIAATATGGRWIVSHEASAPIAVLPLVNLSGEPGTDYFADGLSDEIIRQASGIVGLTVRSRTSSFALKGTPRTVREIANQLNVEYVLEGSVARNGRELRIAAQLVRVRDDVLLWTGTFDRRMTDGLAIQQEISRGIVNALRLKLGSGPRRYDTEAYDLYLRAREATDLRFPGDDEVISLFEQTVAKDPSMAPGYAGLATAYAFRSFQVALDPNRAEELTKMRTAAERAIQLDPSLAEAHSALGTSYARNGRWDLAEQSFRRAIATDPSLSTTRHAFARFVLWPLGRMDEAVREAKAGSDNDPLSPRARYELAEVLLSAGRYDEAAYDCAQLPPELVSASECIGRARLAQGRTAEAIQVLTSSATNNWGYLAYAYAKAGRREEAEALVNTASKRYPNRPGPFQKALVFAGVGDTDRTIDQLQRMAGVGPVRIGFTLNSPEFAFLRDDPRVKALRRQVGLPE